MSGANLLDWEIEVFMSDGVLIGRHGRFIGSFRTPRVHTRFPTPFLFVEATFMLFLKIHLLLIMLPTIVLRQMVFSKFIRRSIARSLDRSIARSLIAHTESGQASKKLMRFNPLRFLYVFYTFRFYCTVSAIFKFDFQ